MRSKDYLAEAQKLTHTGSWAWDPRTEQVLYCSEEMFHIYGLDPRSSLPSQKIFDCKSTPRIASGLRRNLRSCFAQKLTATPSTGFFC